MINIINGIVRHGNWGRVHRASCNIRFISGFYFEFSDEEKEIEALVKKFTKEEIIPKAAYHDRTGEFPWDIAKKAFDLGITNTTIPKKYGGSGLPSIVANIILEECAYGCSGISTGILSARLGQIPIERYGNEEQKKKYIGRTTEELLYAVNFSTHNFHTICDMSSQDKLSKFIKLHTEHPAEVIYNGTRAEDSSNLANWGVTSSSTHSKTLCRKYIGKTLCYSIEKWVTFL